MDRARELEIFLEPLALQRFLVHPIDGSVRSVNPRAFHPVQQHFFQQRDRFLVARSAKRRRWPCCAKLRSVRTAFTQRRCTSSTLITQSP